jgi:hypothetical protein
MKTVLAWILSLSLALSGAGALAETEASLFDELSGLEWSFSSGAGGWSTELNILPDGSFTGNYHDSEMGETGDGYPEGTIYICSFIGRMSLVEQAEENVWKLMIDELTLDGEPGTELIEDGVRFVYTEPYGVSAGDEMLLYAPGTHLDVFSEEMLIWAHVLDREEPVSELDTWFLTSEKNGSGFVGCDFSAYLANPWVDLTAEELTEASGLCFGVPEGAENIGYRYLQSENLVEMRFTLGPDEFCARIRPAAPGDGELLDISGLYYIWENVESAPVGPCRGLIGQAQDGEAWVELCLWYDGTSGLMYSLSVFTADPDGLDLTAVAEQVYVPAGEND